MSKTEKPLSTATVTPSRHTLEKVYTLIKSRKQGASQRSYTARLLESGRPRISKKLGEEAVEVVVAALAEDKRALVAESGDLLYHLLVLWLDAGIKPEQVWTELERRLDVSGIDEKNSRLG